MKSKLLLALSLVILGSGQISKAALPQRIGNAVGNAVGKTVTWCSERPIQLAVALAVAYKFKNSRPLCEWAVQNNFMLPKINGFVQLAVAAVLEPALYAFGSYIVTDWVISKVN